MYGRLKKLTKPKAQKQSEGNINNNIINIFILKKENETIKGRIIRDVRTLFQQEDDYCKPGP